MTNRFYLINEILLSQYPTLFLLKKKLASNANIYMFCDFGRIAPVKVLVEG